jgi:hypothetical protein
MPDILNYRLLCYCQFQYVKQNPHKHGKATEKMRRVSGRTYRAYNVNKNKIPVGSRIFGHSLYHLKQLSELQRLFGFC